MAKPPIYKGQRGQALLQSQGQTAAQADETANEAQETANSPTWASISGKPATFSPDTHNHTTIGPLTDDLEFTTDAKGVVLIDRTTATAYRLYVNAGVLLIEAV